METVQRGFFCTTPYQIITAIILQKSLEGSADIYIVSQFGMAARCVENLGKLNVFRRVKLIDSKTVEDHKNKKSRFLMHLGIVKKYFQVEKIGESILYTDTKYNCFFASSKAFVPRMAYFYCIKHKIIPEFVYYDDGEGSYYFKDRTEPSKLDRIARLLILGKDSLVKVDKMYLHDTELYREINGAVSQRELIPIPRMINNNMIQRIIQNVFEIEETDIIAESAIIIDMIKEVKYGKSEVERINQTYEMIQRSHSKDNIIIKRHPRDNSAYNLSIKQYSNNSIPFEALCSQIDMNNKVLIGIYSTAFVMPKILYGQEPSVILLYKLFDRLDQTEEARIKQDSFYQMCKKRYVNDNKFFIPESMDELEKVLSIVFKT